MAMSSNTKEKYLHQAQIMLNKTSKKPRANVEPFVHSLQPRLPAQSLAKPHRQEPTPLATLNDHFTEDKLQSFQHPNSARQSPSPVSPLQRFPMDLPVSSPQFHQADPSQPFTSTPIISRLSKNQPHIHSESIKECTICIDKEQKIKFLMDSNKELKRLLVASLGNNLKLQMEQLINEKAAMSCDLDLSLKQLAENLDLVDRVSIDCDVWRSKYLASRLMIDELANSMKELSNTLIESQRAIDCILAERSEITHTIVQCNKRLKESQNSSASSEYEGTVLDQVNAMYRTLSKTNDMTTQLQFGHAHIKPRPTRGEKLARKVLSAQGKHVPVPLKLRDSEISSRQHWNTQNQSLLLLETLPDFHCHHCRGPIIHL